MTDDRQDELRSTGRVVVRGWSLVVLAVATVAGACWLAFLCDDAFITFRYVANAHAGQGLVWNPSPFAPVEGYTGFSWAMVLWAVWSWFGVEPPQSANVVSIVCGLGQLAVLAWAALNLRDRAGARVPDFVGLCALATIVGNRTFLQWLTSGLETALFNLVFVAWVLWAFRRRTSGVGWLALWSLLATAVALSRPDGMLMVAATVAVAMLALLRRRRSPRATLIGLSPLLPVLMHLGWRRWFYGEWLPNTYYAKVVAAWPEAGLRYAACFVVEHGTWVLPIVFVTWLVAELRDPRALLRAAAERPAVLAAIGVVVAHAAYYTLKVGGDHFEYRVFSHLVPLTTLAVVQLAVRTTTGLRWPLAATGLLALGSSVGWVHFALTRDLPPHGFQALAPRLPAAVSPIARWYDRQQAWLLFQNIGLRCQQHATILQRFREPYPGRLTIEDPPDPFPAVATGAVGIVGWCLPDCVVIDRHGLNDWVIARTPLATGSPLLDRESLRPVLQAADGNRDGWLDRAELRQGLVLLSGGATSETGEIGADFLIRIMLAMHARERVDALTLREADGIGDLLANVRSMAHERHPPAGYIEDFEPNVTVADGVAKARPRTIPLTGERVIELERKWRAAVLDAQAQGR